MSDSSESESYKIDIVLVLKRDYLSSLFLLSPLALWGAVFIRNVGGHEIGTYMVIAAVGTVLLAGAGMLRIGTIMWLADSGVPAKASISQVIIRRNKGRIEFSYPYGGERHEASVAFRSRDPMKDIPRGMNVTALVDSNKPKRAILPTLFQHESEIFDKKVQKS